MNARKRIFRALIALGIASGWLIGLSLWFDSKMPSQMVSSPSATPTPRFTDADVRAVAVIATYEAQVFPEPLRSQAYMAVAWTMRNRVEIGYGGTVSYTDERVLRRYSSYQDHKDDPPDQVALEVARQVLSATTNTDDPTRGARHYVDHSYWTGTSDWIGNDWKYRGKFSDADVQRLVDDGNFELTLEWRSPPEHPRGALFYGLYFFDAWPPPTPVVTPLPTFTRAPTATRTRTPTMTLTPRLTPSPAPTPSLQPYPRP